MIDTPALRTRVTLVTAVTVVLVVVLLDALVWLSVRDRLEAGLAEQAATRVAVVEQLVDLTVDEDDLRTRLAALPFDVELGEAPADDDTTVVAVPLEDGRALQVAVPRAEVDATLERVLAIELALSLLVLLLVVVVVDRVAATVARPLDQIADTADRIAAGDLERRLRPRDPGTELGRMATSFDRTIDALDRALAGSELLEARSRRFLADAAHQLRTPITGLRASAETLLDTEDPRDRDRLAMNVVRESARLGRLVDQLLRVARLDRGDVAALVRTDLGALAEDEVERQRPLAPSLSFELTVADDAPRVACDPTAVREALANLLDNARRHAHGEVRVEVVDSVGAALVTVADDGPGVPEGHGEQVFERFFTTGDGTGLGLPIARAIAEAHHGSLRWSVDRFALTLPVRPLPASRWPALPPGVTATEAGETNAEA